MVERAGRPESVQMAFPVSDEKITAAETALGRKLPDGLRDRLSRENGGELALDDDWFLYPVRDDTDRKRLSRSANDIITETRNARKWDHFPADGIAIASDGGGDLLVLMPQSDDIFLWQHETGDLSAVDVDWD